MRVAIDEVDLWLRCIPVQDSEFHVELIIQEWRPAHVVDSRELHECFRIWNGSGAVNEIDRFRIIQRCIRRHILKFGDVISTVSIDVSGI